MTAEDPLLRYEDLVVGDRLRLGSCTVTSEERLIFARRCDPQPSHFRDEPEVSGFDGPVASA